jgi:Holliday junction DNA helicase RuvA
MIGKLRGRIDELAEDHALIDVGGVGYVAFCSGRTLSALAGHEFAELLIITHVREDHIHLYGFADAFERDWFNLLTTVQGVGAKMALGLLGTFAPEQIAQAIAAKDTKLLTRASGVGPKLAERLCTELKDKVAKIPASGITVAARGPSQPPMPNAQSLSEDAVSALVHLGYGRSDAFGAVARAAQKLGDAAKIDALIKEGLKELAA